MPSDATNPNIRTSMGSATYAPENDALIWKIKSFPGNKVGTGLQLKFILYACHYQWANGVIMQYAFLLLNLFITLSFLGVYVEGRVQPPQYNSWRSCSRKKSSHQGEVWDSIFYCLRDSGVCFCMSLLAWRETWFLLFASTWCFLINLNQCRKKSTNV